MERVSYNILAPLENFQWRGGDFEIDSNFWIRRFRTVPDLHGWKERLSEDEQNRLFYSAHWLNFSWKKGAEPSPVETINLFLLALWIVKFTQVQSGFYFRLGDMPEADGAGRSRLLDRFHWVAGHIDNHINIENLNEISNAYKFIKSFNQTRGRLNNALLLTLSGCWSHQWQVAIVCYTAALETLLTYDTKPGLTKRLAKVYACLVEADIDSRNQAYKEFKTVYSARSNVTHGRSHNILAAERLPFLVDAAVILQKLWRLVIASSSLATALEGSDAQRKAFFDGACLGFVPP